MYIIQAVLQASQKKQDIEAHAEQASLEQIQKDLNRVLDSTKLGSAQDAVLDVLWFESITNRQRSVDPTHRAIFRWLLYDEESSADGFTNEKQLNGWDVGSERKRNSQALERLEREVLKRRASRNAFLSWLRVGSGVFYVSGKAGDGNPLS